MDTYDVIANQPVVIDNVISPFMNYFTPDPHVSKVFYANVFAVSLSMKMQQMTHECHFMFKMFRT